MARSHKTATSRSGCVRNVGIVGCVWCFFLFENLGVAFPTDPGLAPNTVFIPFLSRIKEQLISLQLRHGDDRGIWPGCAGCRRPGVSALGRLGGIGVRDLELMVFMQRVYGLHMQRDSTCS